MSTPIESNTEQLQEVLQQVYNLPNRSGGSTTPDLVVVVDGISSDHTIFDLSADDVSIESGSVEDAIAKMANGGYVKVLVKLSYRYWTYYYMNFVAENVVALIFEDGSKRLNIRFGPLFHYSSPDASMRDLIEISLDVDGNIYFNAYRNMVDVNGVNKEVNPNPCE